MIQVWNKMSNNVKLKTKKNVKRDKNSISLDDLSLNIKYCNTPSLYKFISVVKPQYFLS